MKRLTTIAGIWIIGCGLWSGPAAGADEHLTTVSELARAQEDLRISELTIARIEEERRALRARPGVDPSVLADYAVYLSRVQAMMEGHRSVVRTLHALAPIPADVRAEPRPVDPFLFDPPPAPHDELDMLDRELDDALTLFDAFILEEQYEARRRRERRDAVDSGEMTNLAREAAAAVERLREKGIEVDTSTPPPQEAGGEESGDERQPTSRPEDGECKGPECQGECKSGECKGGGGAGAQGEAQGGGGSSGGGADGSGSGAGGVGEPTGSGTPGAPGPTGGETPTAPPQGDRPAVADDDIVARQLREAAEKETDPVLKEKLWEEYDKYKRSG